MPIFGYNVIGVNSLGLADTALYGNFDPGRIAIRGNPVVGGAMITGHVYLTPPIVGPTSYVMIGVYDATVGAPATWPLIATSIALGIAAGGPAQWYVMGLLGALTPGSSYVAAVLSNNTHAADVGIKNDPIPIEDTIRTIIPSVFPNPLGVGATSTREWSLFVTYILPPDDDVSQDVAAWSCDCGNNS